MRCKTMKKRDAYLKILPMFMLLTLLAAPGMAPGAAMTDYCQTPPFIVGGVTPNLLFMFDNSSSMYDLTYIDEGLTDISGNSLRDGSYCYDPTYKSKVCSDDPLESCTVDADCTGGATCEENVYAGYFEIKDSSNLDVIYVYNPVDERFETTNAFPGACTYQIANTLCVNVTGGVLDDFYATGNYLNWLTASKLDVQKDIMTGGKYVDKVCSDDSSLPCLTNADCSAGETCDDVDNFLLKESRGCVGRRFLKEALTADFQNFQPAGTDSDNDGRDDNDPNTALGIVFGIKGPSDPDNAYAVSKGGQTYIDVFEGDYNQFACQDAVATLLDLSSSKSDVTNAIEACIEYSATNQKACLLDNTTSCNSDADCIITPGNCNAANDGVCASANDGTCSVTTAGTCTQDDGTCTGSGKNKVCSGGGKDGASCKNNKDCEYSGCTTGLVGNLCTVNADCDVETCTTGTVGAPCTVNADCNTGACTDPLVNAGNPCTNDSDCDSNACIAPSDASKIGDACATDWDCSINKGPCLEPVTTQLRSTFAQSMHSCYQFTHKDQDIGSNEIQQISNPNGCNQLYREYKTCIGGANDGLQCVDAAGCPGGTCAKGPNSMRPGNPVYVCSTQYTGYCAVTLDNWENTSWVKREFPSADDCIVQKYREYCGALDIPPVIDPTDDDTSATQDFMNVPAILGDMGIEAQLGSPIGTATVQAEKVDAPVGLIQEFEESIRMGAMSFNFNGSVTECSPGQYYCDGDPSALCLSDDDCSGSDKCNGIVEVPCPLVCSASTDIPCERLPDGSTLDCPVGETCEYANTGATASDSNFDGAEIIHYISTGGYCSITTATACVTTANCPVGETCVIPVGDHDTGFIKSINDIKATTWTPFAEGFYNAVGYYAKLKTESYANPPVLGTSRGTEVRLNAIAPDEDFENDKNPSLYRCQANNILLISDGMSTTDQNTTVDTLAALYTPDNETGNCPFFAGSKNLDDLAYIGKERNIREFSTAAETLGNCSQTTATTCDEDADCPAGETCVFIQDQSQSITTYVVYTGSESDSIDECDANVLMEETASAGGTTLYNPKNPQELKTDLRNALERISGKAASGTAASVLASGEGSGANLIQAIFYPKRNFDGGICSLTTGSVCTVNGDCNADEVCSGGFCYNVCDENLDCPSGQICSKTAAWTGTISNFWYFLDPRLGNSTIREDTDMNSDMELDKDFIVEFTFDPVDKRTKIDLFADADGDSFKDSPVPSATKEVDETNVLWEAGNLLWQRNVNTSPRTIYTPCIGGTCLPANNAMDFLAAANVNSIRSYLNLTLPDGDYNGDLVIDDSDASILIDYIHGIDQSGLRSRTVGTSGDPLDRAETLPWKLGDIINATPRIVSWVPLNQYHRDYGDTTYQEFLDSNAYRDRGKVINGTGYGTGYVFVNANDGMLHAFKLGQLEVIEDATTTKAKITGAGVGEEAWSFIPKHALPYLQYLARDDYCHVYFLDSTPYIFDASICDSGSCPGDYWQETRDVNSWRTILIGGMRFGGACKNTGSGAPLGVDTPVAGKGFSSYFALDITDPANPELLWEFADAELGFSTTGPAIMRISGRDFSGGAPSPSDQTLNGRWFVVFASGPTGPIDTTENQFKGFSDQKLKLFVLDLKTGVTEKVIDTLIPKAFGGSLINASSDLDLDYQDDVLYMGYTLAEDSPPIASTRWTDGGVLRLVTKEDLAGAAVASTALNPDNWQWSKVIEGSGADNVGTITASVAHLAFFPARRRIPTASWLYFGSGRYFFKTTSEIDDQTSQRLLAGIMDPCLDTIGATRPGSMTCTSNDESIFCTECIDDDNSPLVELTDLEDKTCSAAADGSDACVAGDIGTLQGWRIDLDGATSSFFNERSITDPLASPIGAVFFTTVAPSNDICEFGGASSLWAVNFKTGSSVLGRLKGKALLQVSTGEIKEVDLKTQFVNRGERKTGDLQGVPPLGQGLSIIVPPKAINRIMHIRKE
jgi:type IV pilus assembly protein PilY1